MLDIQEYIAQDVQIGQPFADSDAGSALLRRIRTRQANVAIIGLGYVGLPLAVAFAEEGFRVVGIDIDKQRADSLNAGRSYVSDVPDERLAPLVAGSSAANGSVLPGKNGKSENGKVRSQPGNGHVNGNNGTTARKSVFGEHRVPSAAGSLWATSDFDALFDADAVIICVPTPLSSTKDPDVSYIVAATDEIARRLHRDMLIVLESTTYPGTTDEIVLPRLGQVKVEGSALQVGQDFFLAFSPERIDPGRVDYSVRTTPKVIGGTSALCREIAQTLYECAIETVVPVSTTVTAEMVKLLENTFRAVNIGLINEVAIMCDRLGVDVWEVIDAAKTKPFGFMPFYPGPGLGGHCIPIDPHYLAWKMKTLDYNARFIQLAEEINFGMPLYVVGKVADALNDEERALKNARVLVLGVAYKADIGDLRESATLEVIRHLRERGARVTFHDPYVPHLVLDGIPVDGVTLTRETLAQFDCVVIATAHSSYDWDWVLENSRLVVDTRNATAKASGHTARVVKL